MLDEVLKAESLGDRQQIEYLLTLVAGGTSSIALLKEVCFARSYGFRLSFQPLLALLQATCHLDITNEKVTLGKSLLPADQDRFVESFCGHIFDFLTAEGCLHELFCIDTLEVDIREEKIYFRNNRAPIKYAPLRNLLISFGFMLREPSSQNVFLISPEHHRWFRTGLLDWIGESSTARKLTLEKLKEKIKNQEVSGRLAEEFVVEYERRRLSGHPRLDRIRMISDLDVSAGYDIQSFTSSDSAFIDRYIEVKSYTGAPSFFWSKNEVKVASEKGASYLLCLVDRDQINTPDYRPTFVQDPAAVMFSTKDWTHSCEGFRFAKD